MRKKATATDVAAAGDAAWRSRGAVVLAGLLLAGCFGKSAEEYLSSAKEDLAKKDNASAIIQLKNALQSKPSLAEARLLLGRALLASGDARGAQIELAKAKELGVSAEDVVPALARALLAQGQFKAVLAYADTNLNSPQTLSDLQTSLATAYSASGDSTKAGDLLNAAIAADPSNAQAKLLKFRLNAPGMSLDDSLATLDKIAAEFPSSSEALQMKGAVLQVAGRLDDALAVYRRAIELDGKNIAAQSAAVWVLLAKKDLPAAETQLKVLRAAFPAHVQTRFMSALLALDKGDVKQAEEQVQQLLKVMPEYVPFLQLAGMVSLRKGALTESEVSLSKALAIEPSNTRVRLLLAQAQLRHGDAPKVVKLLQATADDAHATWEPVVLMAQALLTNGETDKASAYFARAAKLDPSDARSRTVLALAQIAKGRTAEGLIELRSIASGDRGSTADLALINFHLRDKNYQAALAAIAALEKKQPDQPLAAQLRGQTEMLLEHRDKARAAFEAALKIEPAYFSAAAALAAMDVADGKPQLARERFERMVAANPKDIQAGMALVKLLGKRGGSRTDLQALLTKIVKANPTEPAPRVALLSLQLEAKDYKNAVLAAQQGLALIPDNQDLLDTLAKAQYYAGDVNQALATYGQMSSLQPGSPAPMMSMARIHMLQNNPDAARQDLKRALAVVPAYVPALRELAMMELAAGRVPDALSAARTAQRQPGNEAAGYLIEGDVQAAQKHWSDAAKAYRSGLARQPAPELAIKLHRALLAGGQADEARQMEATWLRGHSEEPSFLYYLGDLALGNGDFDLASRRYEAVLKAAPDNAPALNNLAWLLNRAKKPGALDYALKATAAAPGTPAYLDTLAGIYADAGQLPKAIEAQRQAVDAGPDNPDFRLRLAKYYVAANDPGNAKQQLQRISGLGGKYKRQAEVKSLLDKLSP
ncbi:XrtA/PEP-CTERM system TPR-repeat protein PrsT [Pelomonas sp. KK5]|uniref:XrtA/PEP-CTERM system TPR-repeat protein PrsT n=1 Tax=Pelomonas sp. KK5 TaxID=1855730 RepID=UPI00097C1B8E|nr:XrtA/PEP-CTERM system TPR-repeat protein PrsT [Pelomonas sp. KK5]